MSGICLDCYNEYCGAHHTKRDVKLKMGWCEDCGQYKPLIVLFRCRSVKERFIRWRDDLEYFARKLRGAVKHRWDAFWTQFRPFPVRRGGIAGVCVGAACGRPPCRARALPLPSPQNGRFPWKKVCRGAPRGYAVETVRRAATGRPYGRETGRNMIQRQGQSPCPTKIDFKN